MDFISSFATSYPVFTTILMLLTAGHSLALAVVNLTETKYDDEGVTMFYRFIEYVAGVVHTDNVKS